jgi:hypothetical protein
MDLVITILGWIALGVISAYLLAIVGKIIFDAATADYKLYKHVRLCRKRLLRKRYEDYAWLLFQLEKDTEIFNLTRLPVHRTERLRESRHLRGRHSCRKKMSRI